MNFGLGKDINEVSSESDEDNQIQDNDNNLPMDNNYEY